MLFGFEKRSILSGGGYLNAIFEVRIKLGLDGCVESRLLVGGQRRKCEFEILFGFSGMDADVHFRCFRCGETEVFNVHVEFQLVLYHLYRRHLRRNEGISIRYVGQPGVTKEQLALGGFSEQLSGEVFFGLVLSPTANK